MPSPYNLFSIGQQAKSTNLTAAHRLNIYFDTQSGPDKNQVCAYGTPGTVLFTVPTASLTRGMHWMEANNTLYVIQAGNLIAILQDGTYTTVGNLATTPTQDNLGPVSMANNGTQICIVTGNYAYIYNISTLAFTNITASLPFPLSTYPVDSVTFLTGRFIINRGNTGQFFLSALYDGLTWNALDYATAETNPDNLVTVIADKQMLVLFGTSSVEIWLPFADVNFPFSRVQSAPADGGLAARYSLSKCGGQLTGLFKNRHGALTVAQLIGYTITSISTPDIDYIFNNYSITSDAVGFGYTQNGKAFYQITFPTIGTSWLYDSASTGWTQLKSWNINRHIAGNGTAYDKKFIVSDYNNGNLYILSADAITDNGAPIEREITGTHSFMPSRNLMVIRRLRIDMESGVGLLSGQGVNPTIILKISRDNGHTWGNELWASFGNMGSFSSRAEWRALGQARDWVFKLRITDPVKVCIIAAIIETRELGA